MCYFGWFYHRLDAELVGGVNEALGDEKVHDEAVHILPADLDIAELLLPLVTGHNLLRGRHGGRGVDGVQVAKYDAGEEHQMRGPRERWGGLLVRSHRRHELAATGGEVTG